MNSRAGRAGQRAGREDRERAQLVITSVVFAVEQLHAGRPFILPGSRALVAGSPARSDQQVPARAAGAPRAGGGGGSRRSALDLNTSPRPKFTQKNPLT